MQFKANASIPENMPVGCAAASASPVGSFHAGGQAVLNLLRIGWVDISSVIIESVGAIVTVWKLRRGWRLSTACVIQPIPLGTCFSVTLDLRALARSLLSLSTISTGVFFGAPMPNHTHLTGARGCRTHCQRQSRRSSALSETDRFAPLRFGRPGARRHPLPDARIPGGEVS
jgi:hypothetical protein